MRNHPIYTFKKVAAFAITMLLFFSPIFALASSSGLPKLLSIKRTNNGERLQATLDPIDLSHMTSIHCNLQTFAYQGPQVLLSFGKETYSLLTPADDPEGSSPWSGHALFSGDCHKNTITDIYRMRLRFKALHRLGKTIEMEWNLNNGQIKLSENVADDILSFAYGTVTEVW